MFTHACQSLMEASRRKSWFTSRYKHTKKRSERKTVCIYCFFLPSSSHFALNKRRFFSAFLILMWILFFYTKLLPPLHETGRVHLFLLLFLSCEGDKKRNKPDCVGEQKFAVFCFAFAFFSFENCAHITMKMKFFCATTRSKLEVESLFVFCVLFLSSLYFTLNDKEFERKY